MGPTPHPPVSCPGSRTVVLDHDSNWLDAWPSLGERFGSSVDGGPTFWDTTAQRLGGVGSIKRYTRSR